jgi:hypothetical protein
MILMGKYYRVKTEIKERTCIGQVYKAKLCTYCSMRKVQNYRKCLFAGRGEIWIGPCRYHDCTDNFIFEEATEQEYIQYKIAQMIKEEL